MLPTIAVIAGTRPEALKLLPVVEVLRHGGVGAVRLISSGQHLTLFDQMLPDIAPDIELGLMQEGDPPGRFLARAAAVLAETLGNVDPALAIVQGDTATAYAGALAAFRLGIPIAHVEAGLRTTSIAEPFPEELFRRAIARLATLHFAPTPGARDNLLAEGVASSVVHVTGNTGIDRLMSALEDPRPSRTAEALLSGIGDSRFALATVHRRENRGKALEGIARGISKVAHAHSLPVILPLHPAPDLQPLAGLLDGDPLVHLSPPMDHAAMVRLLVRAALVVTDSGGLQEEAATLGIPVVVLRTRTERMEAVEDGRAVLAGSDPEAILSAAGEMLQEGRFLRSILFGDGAAAPRIAAHIAEWLRR